jgi:hypothetical protein
MNSPSRLSSLPDSRLQPLYPFRPSSEHNPELLRAEAPANNAGPADFLDGTDDCLCFAASRTLMRK